MDCWAYFPSNMHIKTLFHFFFSLFLRFTHGKVCGTRLAEFGSNGTFAPKFGWMPTTTNVHPKMAAFIRVSIFLANSVRPVPVFSPCIVIFSHWNHSKFKMPEYSLFEANEQIHLNLLLDSAIFLLIKKVICSNSNRMAFFPSISRIFSQSVEEAKVQNLISL